MWCYSRRRRDLVVLIVRKGKKWRKREAVRLELAGVGRRERMGISI